MPSYQSTFCLNEKFPGNLQEKRFLPLFFLGVRIQPRTLWWISILFRTPWQPHSESGGTHFLQKMSVSALQGTVTHSRNPPHSPPHTYSDNTATAGATVSNEQLMAHFEKPSTAKRFVDTCYSSLFYKRTPRHVRNPLVLPGIS